MNLLEDPLRLQFDDEEAAVVRRVFDELRDVVADDGTSSPIRERLFPSAYPGDLDADAEYRSLTETSLRDDRLGRIDACVADLAANTTVELADPDAVRRWLQTLNDLRLAVGTGLGVTEDPPDIDYSDPANRTWVLYGWLTGVQDALLDAVMPD